MVLLGFFGNDFEDNSKAGLFGLDAQGRLTEEKYEHIPGVRIQNAIYSIPGVQWLSENSYFYSLLFNRVWDFFKTRLRDSVAKQTSGAAALQNFDVEAAEYAVPTSATISVRDVALAAALIERIHRFCSDRGIRLIVVDIPLTSGPYHYRSSVPQALLEKLSAARIEYLSSQSLLESFDGTAEIHVPHGHRHISEFTHTLIGTEIGRRLLVSKIEAERK